MSRRKKGEILTIKEKKFVAAKVQGKTNREAYKQAGYSINPNMATNDVAASQISKRENVQKAIDQALSKVGATPEFAVHQLYKIAEQDEEMGAKRLASMNLLELHGYNKGAAPKVSVEFKSDFFSQARKKETIVDLDE